MAAVDDPKTLGRTRLSFANEAEIDEFAATLDRFERGELSPDQWRAYRLVRGNYGQRQDAVQMLRVKIPQGLLDATQLSALAGAASTWWRAAAPPPWPPPPACSSTSCPRARSSRSRRPSSASSIAWATSSTSSATA